MGGGWGKAVYITDGILFPHRMMNVTYDIDGNEAYTKIRQAEPSTVSPLCGDLKG